MTEDEILNHVGTVRLGNPSAEQLIHRYRESIQSSDDFLLWQLICDAAYRTVMRQYIGESRPDENVLSKTV